jgi:ATP-dependent Clp protease ATP-binding subunit ClpA
VLFDEIEKASDAFWSLLLGILDKATLTLGDNRRVDFSRTFIVMTSNLGAREMSDLMTGGIGFAAGKKANGGINPDLDQQINRTAVEAARRKFSPEFMNRIDKVVVFRSLNEQHLRRILELELQAVRDRIMRSASTKFLFQCSPAFKEILLQDGIDYRYGARHLKRSVERSLVLPLSNLVASGQVQFGDSVYVDVDESGRDAVFSKRSEGALIGDSPRAIEEAEQFASLLGSIVLSQQFGVAA